MGRRWRLWLQVLEPAIAWSASVWWFLPRMAPVPSNIYLRCTVVLTPTAIPPSPSLRVLEVNCTTRRAMSSQLFVLSPRLTTGYVVYHGDLQW